MERMFNEMGLEVTEWVVKKKTKFVETKKEATELTERIGYFYVIFDNKKEMIGYGIPK